MKRYSVCFSVEVNYVVSVEAYNKEHARDIVKEIDLDICEMVSTTPFSEDIKIINEIEY